MGLMMSMFSFALVAGAFGAYMGTIPKNAVPTRPVVHIGLMLVGSAGGLAALVLLGGPLFSRVLSVALALMAMLLTAVFLWLLSNRKTPVGDLRVSVGDPLLSIASVTSAGAPFDNADLDGQRVLFKFFRGGWCPYCVAELNLFEAMAPALEAHGVRVVALSKDTVEEAAVHRRRDGVTATLLSDPNLEVIRRFGVEHHKALNMKTGMFKVFGIPLGLHVSFDAMAIPTTLLINEDGIVVWVDQAEDYRIRSQRDRVLAAVNDAFGG
ncbi:MAG: peroxiredoxin family protein [Sandaracinaceae bacterium]